MDTYFVHDIEAVPESEVAGDWKPTEEDIKRGNGDPFPPVWAFKIVTIGAIILDENMVFVKGGPVAGGCSGSATEEEMVQRWIDHASRGDQSEVRNAMKLVDFNGRGFDVPVIQYRAFHYGLRMPFFFGKVPDQKGGISGFSKTYRDRYGSHHLDLTELWSNSGAFSRPPLAVLSKLMGLPGKTGFDGKQVKAAFAEKRFAEIDTYVMQDVFQTAWVFMRYRYLAGEVGLRTYQDAVVALFEHVRSKPEQAKFVEKIDTAALFLNPDAPPPSPSAAP